MSDSIDREGIGMLYVGSAGLALGTTIAYTANASVGWLAAGVIMALALGYEIYQRRVKSDGGSA